MEETPNPNPAEAAPDEPQEGDVQTTQEAAEAPQTENAHWRVISFGANALLVDPAGWWTATIDENDGLRLTKLANLNLHNRPEGMTDSADATIEVAAEDLLDRIRALPYLSDGDLVWPEGDWVAEEPIQQIDPASAAAALKHELDFIREILGCEEGDDAIAKIQELKAQATPLVGLSDAVTAEPEEEKLAEGDGVPREAIDVPVGEAGEAASDTLSDAPTVDPEATILEFAIPGVPHQAVDALKAKGLWNADALRKTSSDDLKALSGVGPSSVDKIRELYPYEEPQNGA